MINPESLKISIITICYNRVATIEQTIQSVLQQTYSNIEYIVIDGASIDGTKTIIEKYASQIDIYISEPDNGMYNALNKGINLSTGDVICLLHSDDIFYSNDILSKYAQLFIETNTDLIYANGFYIPLKTKNEKEIINRIYKSKPFKKWYLYFGWIPLHTTIFAKKKLFDKFGLYEENYIIASDYEISLRWFMNNEIKKIFLDEWVVKMRLGGKSTTFYLQKQKSKEDLEIINKYNLYGNFTLMMKIIRKLPQYFKPKFFKYL